MSASFGLVLRALGYPGSPPGQGSLGQGSEEFRKLISWLEDTKIRLHKVEDRGALRDHASEAWPQTFEAYATALECPFDASDGRTLGWILNYALGLEYRDNAGELNGARAKLVGDERASTRPERPFGDAEGARCAELANEMASALGVPTGQDAAKVLEAVERAAKPLAQARTEAGATSEVDLAALPLGFTTGDAQVDSASLVMRSLFIKDLRELQSVIDETTVGVQEYTANPKTDAKLGRVGR